MLWILCEILLEKIHISAPFNPIEQISDGHMTENNDLSVSNVILQKYFYEYSKKIWVEINELKIRVQPFFL